MYPKDLLLSLLFLSISSAGFTQSHPNLNGDTTGIQQLPSKYLDKVSGKANFLEAKLDKKTDKVLQQMMKQEARMKRKLAKMDSVKAKEVFGNAEQKYKDLEQRLKNDGLPKNYMAGLDTIVTSLKFLQQNPQLISQTKEAQQKLKEALAKVNGLENQFQKAEEIKRFLKERKEFLKKELSKTGFAKELKKLNKNVYYFSENLREIKESMKDSRKAERKAIKILSKTKLFQDFMKKNSMLASLFRMPGDPNDPLAQANLTGLQTRAQVNNLIQQQIAAGGANAQAQFRQNMQEAQGKMNELKEKFLRKGSGGSGSSGEEMPEKFKPNEQRVKNFWKKWELGINVQSNRATAIMPVSSDLGISAGFKPNNWFIAGVGFAGRIGWGKDIRHIAISYSGISARSFMEFKLKSKGSFHAVAGFERNYRSEIRNIEQLKDKSGWQNSGLVGLSKVVSLKTKFFKKTKLSLLWDFLSYQQVPRTQPVALRVGYNF